MARFGSTTPEPEETPPTTPVEPEAPAAPGEITDDELRQVVTDLGFNYDELSDDDREFVRGAELDRRSRSEEREELEAPAPAREPHPLIPTDEDEEVEPEAGAPSVDDSGSRGQGGEAGSDGGAGETVGSPVLPPAVDSFVVSTPQGDIALDRGTVEQALQIASSISQEEIATLNAIRNGLMTPVFVDPQTRQPVIPNQPVAQPQAPEPWVDEQAQQAFGTVEQQIAQLTNEQQQMRDLLMQRQQIELVGVMDAGIERFAKSHGFEVPAEGEAPSPELVQIVNTLESMNILPVFAQQYPGDPGTAIEKALDAVYWSIPQYREQLVQREIAEHEQETRSVSEKKAAAGSIATSPGSAPREAPPRRPQSREEQVAAMAEFIANARAS